MTTRALFRFSLLFLLGLSVLLGLRLDYSPVAAQGEASVYFPETGHWLAGDFLAAFEEIPDPVKIYGLPITDAFIDMETGQEMQYFQKARFVLDSTASSPLRVQRSPLGELLYVPGTELPHAPGFPACQRFEETGFEVCYAFLDFFNANGGVAQFGYPISNFESQAGRIVQYFQLARFEWHPQLPAGQRVMLGDLGSEFFRAQGEDARLLLPNDGDNLPQSILELRVRAFTALAVVPFQGTQTLFVIAQDQNRRPIANVRVDFSVRLPSGESITGIMPPTDDKGISRFVFPVEARSSGVAEVRVSARFDSFQEETRTSFRIWW